MQHRRLRTGLRTLLLWLLLGVALPTAQATLVGQWTFEEGSGTTAADTAGSRTGTLVGSPSWVTGRIGAFALAFNGSSQYLEASAPFTDAVYSWSMWVQGDTTPSLTTTQQPLMNGTTSEPWGFSWGHTQGSFRQAAQHRSAAGTYVSAQIVSTLSAGIWYHIAATYDGTNLKIYLNGALEATTAVSAPISATGTLRIGSAAGSGFPGRVDDVQVYNTALTAGEVLTIFTAGGGGGGGGPPTALLLCATTPHGFSGTGWPLRSYQVFVADTSGNVGPSFAGTVTASLAASPGGSALTGTTSVTAASTTVTGIGLVWVATFTNLILTGQGTYQLRFAASGLTSCTTNAFEVGPSWHLGAAASARGFGLALPGVVVTDFDDVAVPQSGAIDAGALQYRSNTAPSVIPPPQNFRLGT